MIAQLREKAKDLERRGAQVLLVEPNESYRIRYLLRRAKEGAGRQPRPIDEYTQGLGLWLPSHGEFPWPVVVDPGSTAGASFGVAFHGSLDSGDLCSHPDTFVIDRDGILRLVHRYRSTDFLGVDEITQLLDDLEEKRRLVAGLKTGTELIDALGDPDAEVRAGAAAGVYFMRDPGAAFVPGLAKGLGDSSPRLRRLCAEALGRIGPASKPAALALLQALLDVDRSTRSMWDSILRAPRPGLQAVHLSIAERLGVSGEEFRVRGAAIAALVAIGAAAVPDLLGALDDRRAEARCIAAEVLGRFTAEGERIAPALGRVVSGDGEAMVREAAVRSLNELLRYERALVSALRDPDPGVRTAAALTIERTGGCGEWEAVIGLVEALEDADTRVRGAAYYALTHRSDESIPTLTARLEHPDPEMRARAATALKRIDEYGAKTRDK